MSVNPLFKYLASVVIFTRVQIYSEIYFPHPVALLPLNRHAIVFLRKQRLISIALFYLRQREIRSYATLSFEVLLKRDQHSNEHFPLNRHSIDSFYGSTADNRK